METKRKILVKYRNGEKIRQISREAQISRNTIRGIIRNKEQIKEGYERKVQPYPALGEYIGKLEKILRENKNTKPKPTNRHVYEEIVLQGCQYALKIDPLCASKIDPPTAKYTVLFLTSFYIEGLHI